MYIVMLSKRAVALYIIVPVLAASSLETTIVNSPLVPLITAGDINGVDAELTAHPERAHSYDNNGEKMLHIAVRLGADEIIGLLLKAGENVNQRDSYGETPIHWAARTGSVRTVAAIINHGGHVNVENNLSETPVDVAASKEAKIFIQQYIHHNQKEPTVKVQKQQPTPEQIYLFIGSGDSMNIGKLLETEPKTVLEGVWDGMKAIHHVVRAGHNYIMDLLLEKGEDVNVRDHLDGMTPMHWAAMYDNVRALKELLQRGGNVNAIDDRGRKPIDVAESRDILG